MTSITEALLAITPPPRRYPIESHHPDPALRSVYPHGFTDYGPWRIYYDPPPIPTRNCDWHWVHDDFDGAPDGNDDRCGSESSFAAALCACDDWEDDQ